MPITAASVPKGRACTFSIRLSAALSRISADLRARRAAVSFAVSAYWSMKSW